MVRKPFCYQAPLCAESNLGLLEGRFSLKYDGSELEWPTLTEL